MVTQERTLRVGNQTLALNEEGFLSDLHDWSEDVATEFARQQKIELTDAHFEILKLLRSLYLEYDLAPANRALVRVVREQLGRDKGSSLYLMTLFGGSPAKEAARIAGLPKPPHCL